MIYILSSKEKIEQLKDKLTHATMTNDLNSEMNNVTIWNRRKANIFSKQIYTKEQLLTHFKSHNKSHIAIDEMISYRKESSQELFKAVKQLREDCPDKFIALWMGPFNTFKDYKRTAPYVDLFLIEHYFPFKSRFLHWLFYGRKYKRFKKHNMHEKMFFVLGINNVKRFNLCKAIKGHDPNDWWPYGNEKSYRKTIKYIKEKCPTIDGVGFYDALADIDKVHMALDIARSIYEYDE